MRISFFCAIISIFVLSTHAQARAPVSPHEPKREIAEVEKTKVKERDNSIKEICPFEVKASSQNIAQ